MVGVCLEELGARFEKAMRTTLAELQLPFPFHRIGSMFCLFFTDGPVIDLATAKGSNRDMFGKFFRHCLDHGVYFAPSQFETGFLSTHIPPRTSSERRSVARAGAA